jgi:porin
MVKKPTLLLSSALLLSGLLHGQDEWYSFGLSYVGEINHNFDGGVARKSAYLDNIDFCVDVDGEKALNIQGASLHLDLLYNNSNSFKSYVGDAQGTSNIDNTNVFRLYELWWEQQVQQHSFKLGVYDLNSEFDAIEPAGLFLNSSHGIGPDISQSGVNGPSIFPTTSLAFRYAVELPQNFFLQAAILDAVPGDPNNEDHNHFKINRNEGALLILEGNYYTEYSRFGLGSWFYTEKSPEHLSTNNSHNQGIYGFAQQCLYKREIRQVDGWLRVGFANDKINTFGSYMGSGLVFSGYIPSRQDDCFGLAVAHAVNAGDYITSSASNLDRAETNVEFTYFAKICKGFSLQPDLQYIINPSTDPTLDNAFVASLRMEISFL